MAEPRRKVEASEAVELVEKWRSSGKALPAWCRQQGVDGRSLRYWASRTSKVASIRLLEVTPQRAAEPPDLRVVVDDVVIVVRDGFSASTLASVLSVVRGC